MSEFSNISSSNNCGEQKSVGSAVTAVGAL